VSSSGELPYASCEVACSDGHPCGAAMPPSTPKHKTAKGRELYVCAPCLAAVKAGAPRDRGYRIQRNDPCPCGSGKKYKACCQARMITHLKTTPVPGSPEYRARMEAAARAGVRRALSEDRVRRSGRIFPCCLSATGVHRPGCRHA